MAGVSVFGLPPGDGFAVPPPRACQGELDSLAAQAQYMLVSVLYLSLCDVHAL